MGTNMNVETHNLRRVILPDTPKIARDNKVDRPPTAYACTCDTVMKGAKSRRQARRLHKAHLAAMPAQGLLDLAEQTKKLVPVKFDGRTVGTAYLDEKGAVVSDITDPDIKRMLR
jgi:hypothetical protein